MTKQAAAVLVLTVVSAACTPMRSTIRPPYPYMGAEYDEPTLQEVAEGVCTNRTGAPLAAERRAFTTDGCSVIPDGAALSCCIAHDVEYWCGGSPAARRAADRALRECVGGLGYGARARLMYLGVRFGGWRFFPFPWRWGYGYPWPFRESDNESPVPGVSRATDE
ncbi:MAG: hypothetical protein OEQ25_11690 [Gammaproteobacteria bacterium]|nr:hypothetical protein [Gammaproteobacteria bacterium]MDH3507788.1 hypothetical protein [Gammaproteobacteria bacterium]